MSILEAVAAPFQFIANMARSAVGNGAPPNATAGDAIGNHARREAEELRQDIIADNLERVGDGPHVQQGINAMRAADTAQINANIGTVEGGMGQAEATMMQMKEMFNDMNVHNMQTNLEQAQRKQALEYAKTAQKEITEQAKHMSQSAG